MADFKRAFSEGLKASTDAERARTEIRGVLASFAAAVGEASGGMIVVKRGKNLKQELAALGEWIQPRSKIESREVLFASRVDAKNAGVVEIGEYELAAFGYPVVLTYGENDVVCEDKVSLESELARLLSDPGTGTKLRRLMAGAGGAPQNETGGAPPKKRSGSGGKGGQPDQPRQLPAGAEQARPQAARPGKASSEASPTGPRGAGRQNPPLAAARPKRAPAPKAAGTPRRG